MKKPILSLPEEVMKTTKDMTNAQFGDLIRALVDYSCEGQVYQGEDTQVEQHFRRISNQIERYSQRV